MRNNMTLHLLKLLLLTILFTGCGYQFQGSGTVLPDDVRKIYIPTVENLTAEARITNYMTEAIRERFERFGVITVVEKSDIADATLNIEIRSLDREARSVTSGTDTVLQYETVALLWGDLRRTDGRILWRNPAMRVTKSFGATGQTVVTSSSDFAQSGIDSQTLASLSDIEVSRGQEQEALLDLSEEVAKFIYDDSVAPDF